jgi:hypothetical protein
MLRFLSQFLEPLRRNGFGFEGSRLRLVRGICPETASYLLFAVCADGYSRLAGLPILGKDFRSELDQPARTLEALTRRPEGAAQFG